MRTARVTLSPRYRCQGNSRSHRVAEGYKRTSTLGGRFEDTRLVVKHILIPGIIGFGLCLIATFAIVAFGGPQ